MNTLIVRGESGSSALVEREDLFRYSLAVEWAEDLWRDTRITLPNGTAVAIDQFVGANMQRPRKFHPEYALAIELLIANAVTEAKRRGWRIASIELGVWPWLTITELGKRVTKIGLAEPMVLHDGRTTTRTGYMWIDHESEGVMLVPWANGDQLIRLVDERGYYVVPVDERTADATKCRQVLSWKSVQHYPALPYDTDLAWQDVPLLGEGDKMLEQLECQQCLVLMPVDSFVKDEPSGKRCCAPCRDEIVEQREIARLQGWDFDKRAMLDSHPSRQVLTPEDLPECDGDSHHWGVQLRGTAGSMRMFRECILCGEPIPKEKD